MTNTNQNLVHSATFSAKLHSKNYSETWSVVSGMKYAGRQADFISSFCSLCKAHIRMAMCIYCVSETQNFWVSVHFIENPCKRNNLT